MAKSRSQAGGGGEFEAKRPPPVIKIPHDPFNEAVLLAAMMRSTSDNDVAMLTRVRADLFLVEEHALAWGAMLEARRRQLDLSVDLVCQLAGSKVEQKYLTQLLERHPSCPPNLRHHVDVLQWDRARGDAVSGPIGDLLQELRNPTARPERVRALAKQVGLAFDGIGGERAHDPSQLVREQTAEIEARCSRGACWPFGIEGLDQYEDGKWRLVPGAAPGKITVVTACSGSGKSLTCANMVLGLARQQRKVGVGAWEMGCGVTLELLATISIGLSRYRVSVGDLTQEEVALINERMEAISQWVRFFDLPVNRGDGKRRTNDAALDALEDMVGSSGVEVMFCDLWKKLLVATKPEDEEMALDRQQHVAERSLIHYVLVQQQRSKDVEARPDNRPTREGVKGSSAWVDVADTMLGVHNPALWKHVEADTLEVDILKQRYGKWPLAVEFNFDPDLGKISGGRSIDYDPPAKFQGGGKERVNDLLGGGGKGGRGGRSKSDDGRASGGSGDD